MGADGARKSQIGVNCPSHPEAAVAAACAVCFTPLCLACLRNTTTPATLFAPPKRIQVCSDCLAGVPLGGHGAWGRLHPLVRCSIVGVPVSVLCGAAWAYVGIAWGLATPWLAIPLGFLAGVGMVVACEEGRGPGAQWSAVVCALVGFLLYKYLLLAAWAAGGAQPDRLCPMLERCIEWRFLSVFVENFGRCLTSGDLVCMPTGFLVAWKMSAPPK